MIISTSPGFLRQNFINEKYIVRDNTLLSPNYFDITFFPESIGGGISLIKLRGNEENLAFDRITQVEILDSIGTPVRHEVATHIDRFQNYYISIYVYDTTAPGTGTVSIVGVAKRDLDGRSLNPSNVNDLGHNLIWTRPITILPNARNNSELVFDDPPFVSVAQVITAARVAYNANVDTQYSAVTSSNLTIATSKFKGFDKKRGSNFVIKNGVVKTANKDKIVDNKAKQVSINANNQAKTTNYVEMPTRIANKDVIGGFILNEDTRYNTVLLASESFFSSSYVGGIVEFFTSSYTLAPEIPTGFSFGNSNVYDQLQTPLPITQSLQEQLSRWSANILKIKNDKIAYLDQPVQVNLRRTGSAASNRGTEVKHTYYDVTSFTASIVYTPDSLLYTTSSEVSQSYLQFTLQDVKPIGGQVHKIQVYYRRGSEIGDWELLNEQLISPVEFLTDARYPNQTNYGLDISDYYLLGHFIDQTVIDDNWSSFIERATTFDTTTASIDNSTLLNSVKLECSASLSKVLTTRFYQNYAEDAVYTLSFNCILAPYTQLELYQNSTTLQTTVFGSDPFPRAFDKTLNYELTKYSDRYNRYGKLIGKINNNTNISRDYTRVVFDFKTDKEGLGRPLFRVVELSPSTTASAYLSEVSITPRQLNGFTPTTMQFAFPAKLDTNIDLNETIDYKLEYYDYTGNQSEYVTYLEDNVMELQTEIPTTACQSENATFKFRPFKYYTCDYTKLAEASQSVLLNYPSESLVTYAVPLPRYTSSLYSIPIEVRFWPDWDLKSPYNPTTDNINHFIDTYYKGVQNYSLGTPNFTSYASESLATVSVYANFWNLLRPSMSIVDGNASSPATKYIAQYPISISFDFDGPAGPLSGTTIYVPDVAYGLITSSWQYIDRFTAAYIPGTSGFPDGAATTYTRNVYYHAYASASVDTIDGRIFWEDGGAGISRLNVSNSYYSYSLATTNNERTEALKKRRLYWPASGSTFVKSNYFTQNGGIYNVKFKLKSRTGASGDFSPSTGSFMRVYLFDVASSYVTESNGTQGWYPPPQNIVKIGNEYTVGGVTVPQISFLDASTGYQYDEYNINLVQYGAPAQLVFEACGENDNWFGIVVDDIEFCKIGTTTDPYYIKPATIANNQILAQLPENTYPTEK